MPPGIELGLTYLVLCIFLVLWARWARKRYPERQKPIPPRHPRQTKRGW